MAELDPSSPTRRDGSVKSKVGFLGPIPNLITGGTMTEFSTDMEVDGKSIDIPTMVPTLTYEELEYLRTLIPGQGFNLKNPIELRIINKARSHAMKRLKEGKSPYYQDDEDRVKKAEGDEVRSEIDQDLEDLLSGKGSLAEDPLYKLSMMVIGPSGKFKAADIVVDFFKHQRIQSLLKSGAPGDITEIKQIQKGLKIKNPAEAEKLYMDLQNKGKELASPEDIQRAIEEFLKK